jgi:NTE family protein
MRTSDASRPDDIALVFSGGVGLGAYQAGAYSAMHVRNLRPHWVAGSSVGAVNAALIAGNREADRLDRLQEFWKGGDWLGGPEHVALGANWQHLQNWMSAVSARLFGVAGLFHPRVAPSPGEQFSGLYDLSPLRRRLERLIDFELLNGQETRISIATTDIESGDLIVFDTAMGARISIDHLLASCGFLPEFAPVEIDGRLLGDGGLSANAPVEAVLVAGEGIPNTASNLVCFIVDLFARDGSRPADLESALQRKNDLLFGN